MLGQSKLWISFNYACVAIALGMLALSLLLMPVDLSTKGYVGMGILFLRVLDHPGQNPAGSAYQ